MDAVLSMEDDGPSAGIVRKTDLIAASSDAAILDAYLLNELNYDVQNSDLLKNLKITKDIFNKIDVVGEDLKSFNLKNFKFPILRKFDLFPKFAVRLLGKLLLVKASINERVCVKCMLCIRACPVGAIQVGRSEYLYADTEKCISCFCCHEMCPRKAIGFKKSILAKIFIKEV